MTAPRGFGRIGVGECARHENGERAGELDRHRDAQRERDRGRPAQAERVFEGTYRVPYVQQASIEPHIAITWLDGGSDRTVRLLEAVNRTGEVFLSHTKLNDRYVLHLAIGNIRTEEKHIARAWELLNAECGRLMSDE